MAMRVAFIGLGVMGYSMAGHLSRTGHDVAVYNRTAGRAQRWVGEYGGRSGNSPAAVSENADIVLACVGRDADVESVTLGDDGAFRTMNTGAVFVDHTTASASLARGLANSARQR